MLLPYYVASMNIEHAYYEATGKYEAFEGVCIAQKHGGARATFTVRKISFGHGVERIFPLHSKVIDKVEVVRSGRVRRAKLYYIRELRGKAARIKEVKAAVQ